MCKNVDDWEITERFLEFKDFYKKTGSEIAGMIESVLMDQGIDISDCRDKGMIMGQICREDQGSPGPNITKKNSPCLPYIESCGCACSSPEVSTFYGYINCTIL